MYKRLNGAQIAPCIVSKARHALSISTKRPTNGKICSKAYWDEACEIIGRHNNIGAKGIKSAKSKFEFYMNLN